MLRREAARLPSRRCCVADATERLARVEPVLQAARMLADPTQPASQRLRDRLEQTTGLSRPSIDAALERCLEQHASVEELRRLLERVPLAPRALLALAWIETKRSAL